MNLHSTSIDGKDDYIEGQSKRNNIINDGIPESKRESWEETDRGPPDSSWKVEMDEERIEVERAHRMGDPTTEGDRHRPNVVKFLIWKYKEAVMARENQLRGTNIYLNKD